MMVAISSQGKDLDSMVDYRFGRCLFFIIVDSETLKFEAIENPGASAMGGAAVQAAGLIANKGIEAVITGNAGPNGFRTLNAANIKVYEGATGTIREAITKYKNGELREFSRASVPGHFGMGNR